MVIVLLGVLSAACGGLSHSVPELPLTTKL